MKEIQACLFDLDGVLVDTAKYHFIAWKELADDLGFPFTEQDNERLKGVSRVASLNILLEIGGLSFSEAEKVKLAEKKNNRYVEYITTMDSSEILPGAIEFLKECNAQGIKVALGSASKNAMMILDNTGLTPYFDAIIDGTHTSVAKPDPEVFLLGASALGIAPDHCVVFEDAEAGIEAAIRAGMANVGIGSPETLSAANMVVPSLQQMNVALLRESFASV